MGTERQVTQVLSPAKGGTSPCAARPTGKLFQLRGQVSALQRRLIAAATVMRRGGFYPYDREWWHFTLRGETDRDSCFNFAVK
jgi:D-alanyl-D-alanine dipeptidase